MIPLHPIFALWDRYFGASNEPSSPATPEDQDRPSIASRNHSGYPPARGHPYEIYQPHESQYEDDKHPPPAYGPSKYPGPPTPPPDEPANLPSGASSPAPGFASPNNRAYSDPWRRNINMPSAFPHSPPPAVDRLHSAPAQPYPPLIVESGPAAGITEPTQHPLGFSRSLQ